MFKRKNKTHQAFKVSYDIRNNLISVSTLCNVKTTNEAPDKAILDLGTLYSMTTRCEVPEAIKALTFIVSAQ